jgi:hypothetical protein
MMQVVQARRRAFFALAFGIAEGDEAQKITGSDFGNGKRRSYP